MNSLNILSARVIGPTPPQTLSQPRDTVHPDLGDHDVRTTPRAKPLAQATSEGDGPEVSGPTRSAVGDGDEGDEQGNNGMAYPVEDEKSPLLPKADRNTYDMTKSSRWRTVPKRLAQALLESIRWVLATLAAPGAYLVSCLYDDQGTLMFRRIFPPRRGKRTAAQAEEALSRFANNSEKRPPRRKQPSSQSSPPATNKNRLSTTLTSDSELDPDSSVLSDQPQDEETPVPHTRSKSLASSSSEDLAPTRRSIRIKLYNQDPQKRKKGRPTNSSKSSIKDSRDTPESDQVPTATPATLKSPTSPTSSLRLTRYPRAPNPPRPLIPRRMPSYTFPTTASSGVAKKTLILDLDETLIHSMAKGGRMSTGHMVEVKLNAPVGFSGGIANAPRHPILYYVHKRPHCDDFLRKVCKWYNLVAFTASVQEYADPVIDWLEQDRKYFSGRYYRQHCTFRGGNYIKDISSVEPDLSKVMIVDNSPSSYVFHEDNAIPIEGWINDPTDNDLLHLVPLLEALQYVTDVRALLALRGGEPTA